MVSRSLEKAGECYKEWKSQQKTQWPLDKKFFSRIEEVGYIAIVEEIGFDQLEGKAKG